MGEDRVAEGWVPDAACRLHPDVEVRPSPVAGRGLFATTDLPAGTVVSRLGGTLVDGVTLRRLLAEAAAADETVDAVQVGRDTHLVLAPGNRNRFVNHACDPNLGWADATTLTTRSDVAAGEELLVDYAMSIADEAWFLRCHCASYRCRQVVEGSDWRIPQLQQRYAGWWTPYVAALVEAAQAPEAGSD